MMTETNSALNNSNKPNNMAYRLFSKATLAQKLLIPIALVAVLLLTIFGYFSYQQRYNSTLDQARVAAKAVQRQIRADRTYYSNTIVGTAREAGLEISDQYHESSSAAIPFPATFVREVSEFLEESATGSDYRTTSRSLFPINPQQGPRNETERQFMELNFAQGIDQETLTTINGEQFYTLYVPDIASESCLACHNSFPDAPKTDYQVGDVMGSLIISVPVEERLDATITDTVVQVSLFGAILLVIGAILYPLAQRTILSPIRHLVLAASEAAKGDLAIQMKADGDDEVGQLITAFNDMTSQLRQTIASLETRSQQLENVTEFYQSLSRILNRDDLLFQLVALTQETFNYYHVQVYLLDEENDQLVLAEGYGEVGVEMKAQGHAIPLTAANNLIARVAQSGQVESIEDVSTWPEWEPNPLLPDTQAEMAVPIILDGKVIGVLHVQDDDEADLDENDETLLRSLSSQVSIVLRNIQLFEEVETSLADVHQIQEKYTAQMWDREKITRHNRAQVLYSRDTTLGPDEAAIEASHRHTYASQKPTLVSLNGQDTSDSEARKVLVAPISLVDTKIGYLQFHGFDPDRQWTKEELAVVEAVVDQIAQTAENLRLFEETRERAGREQVINQATEKIRGALDMESLIDIGVAELTKALGANSKAFIRLGSESELKTLLASNSQTNGNGTSNGNGKHNNGSNDASNDTENGTINDTSNGHVSQ